MADSQSTCGQLRTLLEEDGLVFYRDDGRAGAPVWAEFARELIERRLFRTAECAARAGLRVGGGDGKTTARTWFALADALAERGDRTVAEIAYREALAAGNAAALDHAELGAISRRLGWLYWRRHQQEDAASAYARSLDHYERASDVDYTIPVSDFLARLLSDLGRNAEAEAVCRRGLAMLDAIDGVHRGESRLWAAFSRSLSEQGRPTEAVAAARRGIETADDSPAPRSDSWHQLGRVLDKAGRTEEAVSALEQALSYSVEFDGTGDPEQLRLLGYILYYKLHRARDAEPHLREAWEAADHSRPAKSGPLAEYLGSVLLHLGKLEEAEVLLHRAVELLGEAGFSLETAQQNLSYAQLALADASEAPLP